MERVMSQNSLLNSNADGFYDKSGIQSKISYKAFTRKPTTHYHELKKKKVQNQLDIRYFSSKMNEQCMMEYLKNFKFRSTIVELQKSSLTMCNNVLSVEVCGQNPIEELSFEKESEDNQNQNTGIILKERRDSQNICVSNRQIQKDKKTDKDNRRHKLLIKSYNKIKFLEEQLRAQVRKNNELDDIVKKQANKIIYLDKQIQLKNQILTKSHKKVDKNQVIQLKHFNTELQTQNRQIKSMLYKVTQQLKYYETQVNMLRKKKNDAINLELKCLKLAQKNKYLQQKLEKNTVAKTSTIISLKNVKSQKVLKMDLDNQGQSLISLNTLHPTNQENVSYFKKPLI